MVKINLAARAEICSLMSSQGQSRLRLKSKTKMNTSSYKLIPAGNGKIAPALCMKCAEGETGEFLIRSGLSQSSFCAFLAQIAYNGYKAGKTAEQMARAFSMLSGANASAAQKALADCTIEWADGKKQSVAAYWLSIGSAKGAPDLKDLEF